MANNFLLYSENFGFNTYYIEDNMKDLKRTKDAKDIPVNKETYVIRWGTGAHVANGPKIINRKSAIKATSNKGVFRKLASDNGIAPKTWLGVGDFIKWTETAETIPSIIVRPQHHSRSEDLYFCKDKKDLDKALAKVGPNYYISEYIKKDEEYRVFVASGRAFVVAKKNHKKKDDISWGCVDQGTLDYVSWEDWPKDVVEVAIKAFNLSKLDFAAVDIIVKGGKAYFLECNTAPEVWEYYGQCFAKIFTYMIDKGRDRIAVKVDAKFSWKNYIHPAMSKLAQV